MGVSDYLLNFADVIQSISNMVTEVNSKNQLVERNFKRNEMLAEYFFGLSKMVCSGIGIGALSPLFTGEAMGVTNYVCMGCAVIAAACFAYAGNYLLKVELKKEIIMEMLTILFAIAAIIGVGLVIWMKYTESGKKWVEGEY